MKKKSSCLTIFASIILLIIAIIFFSYSVYSKEVNQAGNFDKNVTFTINSGESVSEIASNLQNKGVITNPFFFIAYIKIHKLDSGIEAGTFSIPAHSTLAKVATIIQKGNISITVTIPEGLRLEEEAATIDKQLSNNNSDKKFSEDQFITLAKSPQYQSRPFIPTSAPTLEGFLFPDTYTVDPSIDASQMINLMLDTFQQKVYSKYSTPTNGLSFYDNLVLASMLEREAKTDNDKQMISDILIKRLNDGAPLGIDSTVQYMLGYSSIEHTWWRQTITENELNINSPYNTRLNAGLPPTPISNPGVASVNDAEHPIQNPYYYYISDANGVIHYAKTSSEQNANISRYLY